jgi:hypothetical protein
MPPIISYSEKKHEIIEKIIQDKGGGRDPEKARPKGSRGKRVLRPSTTTITTTSPKVIQRTVISITR